MADIVSPDPYATVADLTAFWKTPDDSARALVLLKLASNRLRLIGEDLEFDTDARANSSAAYLATIQWVVMEATKRALLTPTDMQPVDTFQQTAGPYSENIKYSNPSGDLWFKKSELSSLGLYGRQRLGSVSTSQTEIYES
jgi:hypothetical protein